MRRPRGRSLVKTPGDRERRVGIVSGIPQEPYRDAIGFELFRKIQCLRDRPDRNVTFSGWCRTEELCQSGGKGSGAGRRIAAEVASELVTHFMRDDGGELSLGLCSSN